MNDDSGPGGVLSKSEPPVNRLARKPPPETQTVNADPGALMIL